MNDKEQFLRRIVELENETPLTFKNLIDAAVIMGEQSEGDAQYFLGLYQQSDEARDLKALQRFQLDLVQDQFEGALVPVTLLDEARRIIAEKQPDHPFLAKPMPSYGVWETQRKALEEERTQHRITTERLTDTHARLRQLEADNEKCRAAVDRQTERLVAATASIPATPAAAIRGRDGTPPHPDRMHA